MLEVLDIGRRALGRVAVPGDRRQRAIDGIDEIAVDVVPASGAGSETCVHRLDRTGGAVAQRRRGDSVCARGVDDPTNLESPVERRIEAMLEALELVGEGLAHHRRERAVLLELRRRLVEDPERWR